MAVDAANVFLLLGAWLFWGTYPVPFKSPAAKKANCDPFAFQYMKSIMVFITSWLILTWRPFTFTIWGFVGAALWIPSGLLFITAVKLTGVAFATPIANGIQVMVSFCWGAFFFGEEVHNIWLSILAILIMVVGMFGISISVNWETMKAARLAKKQQQYSINVGVSNAYDETTPLTKSGRKIGVAAAPPPVSNKAAEFRTFVLGIAASITCGFFGGTQNVPLNYAPSEAHGIQYVISFGIGAVCVITVWTGGYLIFRWFMKMGLPTVNLRISAAPGALAGLLWSIGNVCQIYTTLAYGQTVGFPLVQCSMMVAGCWGVFYYGEAPTLWLKALFLASCVTLLGGVTLLSFYG